MAFLQRKIKEFIKTTNFIPILRLADLLIVASNFIATKSAIYEEKDLNMKLLTFHAHR